jgi:hypothetical protein
MLLRELKIDEEFDCLLRKQTELEATEMGESIAQHGYLSPIIVWKDTGIVVDGMHRLRHWLSAQAMWESLKPNMFGKRPLPEPLKPDFIQRTFADRHAVREFIQSTQAARRNMTQHELATLRGKAFFAALDTMSKEQAAESIGEKHGVSPKTVLRDAEYTGAVEELREVVPAIDVICNAPDAPSQRTVKEVRKTLVAGKQAAAGMDFKDFVAPDGRTVGEMLEQKLKASRLDAGHSSPKSPAWQAKLAAFEKVMEQVLSEGDENELRALRACVRKLVTKLPKQREKGSLDIVSKPEIPQKVMGTPLSKYAEAHTQEATPC